MGREFSRKQQIDSIRFWMDQAISSMQETEAMIVDISFNFGGFDAAALAIAGYFPSEPVFAFQNQVFYQGNFYVEDQTVVYPSSNLSYSRPVYVLMSDISRSAAEGFAMMMASMPHVTLVGTPTLGTLSGMLGKSVSDFYTTCSNQRLVNTEGKHFEGIGVQPEIEIELFPRGNVMRGHMEAVRTISRIAKEKNSI
ncbi:MAG: S41 family peptidase [Bacteroidota bacterium]